MTETYRAECHFDECEMQFVGIDRDDYVEHIREEHGAFKAHIYAELVIDEAECPECYGDGLIQNGCSLEECPFCEGDGVLPPDHWRVEQERDAP